MKSLRDRVAVVTGAASGIGLATAEALARRGVDLALVDIDETALAAAAQRVQAAGRRATTHAVDVSSEAAMRELPERVVAEHRRVHIVVNNAGVSLAASFERQSLEDLEWLMGINFWGVVYGCKFFLPKLREVDEAHIVNISSVFGILGVPLNSAYCASKFAVRGLSESLRAELDGSPIGVTSVHPGGIATNIVRSARFDEEEHRGLRGQIERRFERMLSPDKAAEAIVRGIESNAARVLITREAYVIDIAKRLFPAYASELLGRHWRTRIMGFLAPGAGPLTK
jgi:short-subunit dehydrogenase